LLALQPADDKTVYKFRFKNFLGNKWLRFGEWGNDKHIRLFNRKHIKWNEAEVHEQLIFPEDVKVETPNGYVLHYTVKSVEDYKNKMKNYAQLNAEKYFRQGKKGSAWKQWLSPVFSFIQNYIFKLGFLDGAAGFTSAKITAWYTFLKYQRLKELSSESGVGSRESGKTS